MGEDIPKRIFGGESGEREGGGSREGEGGDVHRRGTRGWEEEDVGEGETRSLLLFSLTSTIWTRRLPFATSLPTTTVDFRNFSSTSSLSAYIIVQGNGNEKLICSLLILLELPKARPHRLSSHLPPSLPPFSSSRRCESEILRRRSRSEDSFSRSSTSKSKVQ